MTFRPSRFYEEYFSHKTNIKTFLICIFLLIFFNYFLAYQNTAHFLSHKTTFWKSDIYRHSKPLSWLIDSTAVDKVCAITEKMGTNKSMSRITLESQVYGYVQGAERSKISTPAVEWLFLYVLYYNFPPVRLDEYHGKEFITSKNKCKFLRL